MKCQKGGANGPCGSCEACAAAYDWRVGDAADALQVQAKDAWHHAGMTGMSAADTSRFCAMLERIAAFLAASRVAQQQYDSPLLGSLMQQLSDGTWEIDAPSQLSDPAQIARAQSVLDGRIMTSVNGIASVVKSVSKKGRKKNATADATIPNLHTDIVQDRDAIVGEFDRYKKSVTLAKLSDKAGAVRRARVGAAPAVLPAPRVRASLPVPSRKKAGTWSTGVTMPQGGFGDSGSRYQPVEAAASRPYSSSGAGVTNRIGSYMTNAFSDDALAMTSGTNNSARTVPRLAFGLDTRRGQDLFPDSSIVRSMNIPQPAVERLSDDRNVYVQSNSGGANAAGRMTR